MLEAVDVPERTNRRASQQGAGLPRHPLAGTVPEIERGFQVFKGRRGHRIGDQGEEIPPRKWVAFAVKLAKAIIKIKKGNRNAFPVMRSKRIFMRGSLKR
jgi:hypothetical protein